MQIILPKQWSIFHFLQIEKCKDVTLGYSTEKKCDKWPKTVCELETVTRKRYTPETKCDKKPRNVSLHSVEKQYKIENLSVYKGPENLEEFDKDFRNQKEPGGPLGTSWNL